MNQQQTKYILERINAITRRKVDRLRETYPDTFLPADERFKAFKAGRYTVVDEIPLNTWGSRGDISYWVLFDDEVLNEPIRQAKRKEIEAEARNLTDQVMLGEDEGLLAALQDFDNKEF